MIELDNIDIKLNYLSFNLIKDIIYIYKNISFDSKLELNNIVKVIIIKMSKYFNARLNHELINHNSNIKYNIIDTDHISRLIEIKNIEIISTSRTILRKMNTLTRYFLYFKQYKIKVIFYHNRDTSSYILEQNIMKIMMRLYNLFLLYSDKNPIILNMKYIFYLYNNPRCANKNKYGKKYLIKLKRTQMKNFNTSSGVTLFRKNKIIVSRTEDCIGLLTHEVLHACDIINVDISMNVHGIDVNFTEGYINMFASILNAYLTNIEYNSQSNLLEKLIMIELIHSIIHSSKLLRISGYSMEEILDINNNVDWYQDAFLYEYIIVKMLLFINFEHMLENKNFELKFLSLTEPWGEDNSSYNNMIKANFRKYSLSNSNMIKEIDRLFSQYLDKTKSNNMIMQYNAIDMIIIDNNNISTDFKNKYLSYKIKYLDLRKN